MRALVNQHPHNLAGLLAKGYIVGKVLKHDLERVRQDVARVVKERAKADDAARRVEACDGPHQLCTPLAPPLTILVQGLGIRL